MSLDQKRARVFGVLYLITFATSIPALLLYQPVLDDPVGYIAGGGHDKQVLFGAFLELLLIISNIGTAVVIVPIMWRRYKELSIGYVTARLLESTFILAGILAVLAIITLRNQDAGASEGTLRPRTSPGHAGGQWRLHQAVPVVQLYPHHRRRRGRRSRHPCVRAAPAGHAQGQMVVSWRRGRDSNPRYGCPYNGFRDRPVRPLRHPSDGFPDLGGRPYIGGLAGRTRAVS